MPESSRVSRERPAAPPCTVAVDPPLEPAEVAFLDGFTTGADLPRVWPGQPSRHCPWRAGADGTTLTLDVDLADAEPAAVAGWLRFLSREFLAPCSTVALDVALATGLRAGHRLDGAVTLGARLVSVRNNRVEEGPAPLDDDGAVVLPLRQEPSPT